MINIIFDNYIYENSTNHMQATNTNQSTNTITSNIPTDRPIPDSLAPTTNYLQLSLALLIVGQLFHFSELNIELSEGTIKLAQLLVSFKPNITRCDK